MKRNNLFKAVGIVLFVYVILSWIVPIIYKLAGWQGDVSYQIGITSIISLLIETFSGFGSTILYILLVGAFYGVLKKTGAYEAIVDTLSAKAAGKEKKVLIATIIVIAVISSITGLDLGLLIVFPILIGIITKLGYDKLTALAATVGATIIGMYGATFAGTLYGANHTIFNDGLGVSIGKYDQIVPKLVLFVVALGGLIYLVLNYIKKNGFDKPTKEKKVSKTKKSNTKKVKLENNAVPALIVFCLLCLAFVLGTTNWAGIFKDNLFVKAHDAWTQFTIGNFPILNKLIGGVEALGTWYNPARFQTYSLLLIIAMIVLKLIYKVSKEDAFDGFVDGIKSFVVPALLALLAYSIFVFGYYYPVLTAVTGKLVTGDFNVALSGIFAIINSVFYVDYYYLAYSALYGVANTYKADASTLSILSVMFVNIYSLVMLIAPTSVLLLVSLSISEVKYTDWIKFIWKLVLGLFIVSFIVFSIMMLV